eukprot:TRINITY_DN2132_c0_g1_i1.p1 TRINITY_DN2132_c0_g1~~TRINITY_DN2132_c0_g1_i1.p1  ORF type:complete len:140 (+),score=26.24 TRINITY_DN2132_c0_g1_i1:31-420(+)
MALASWIGRMSHNMREIRIIYCAENTASKGAREFVDKNYETIKGLNPTLPILVRTFDQVEPEIQARYDYSGWAGFKIGDKTEPQIFAKLKELNDIGEATLKADLLPWQSSYPQDADIVDYNPMDIRQHH